MVKHTEPSQAVFDPEVTDRYLTRRQFLQESSAVAATVPILGAVAAASSFTSVAEAQ